VLFSTFLAKVCVCVPGGFISRTHLSDLDEIKYGVSTSEGVEAVYFGSDRCNKSLLYMKDTSIFTDGSGALIGIAMGYGLGDRRFDSRQELGIFLFTTASRPALGLTQPPIQSIPAALPLRVKRPRREAYYSPASSTEVKNAWSYTSTPPIRLHGVVLS
jgi:hypothetical protein